MNRYKRVLFCGVGFTLALFVSGGKIASSQSLYLIGQNVQPVFEGWEKNSDGSFTMVFGYLNRNYVEEPEIPIGTLNSFSPGRADRGQPTHFYPRRQSFVFSVTVPADWGEKELVWTVTHNGRTGTAYGALLPSWEIDEGVWKANRGSGIGGRTKKDIDPNLRPTVRILGDAAVTVGSSETFTLTVAASDDGKPGPRPTGGGQGASAPSLTTTGVPGITARVGPASQDMVKARTAYQTGLGVSWLHYRGPGKVTFEPMAVSVDPEGKATTTVRFSQPGTYVVRAVADDGIYTTPTDITVTVKGTAPTPSQVKQ